MDVEVGPGVRRLPVRELVTIVSIVPVPELVPEGRLEVTPEVGPVDILEGGTDDEEDPTGFDDKALEVSVGRGVEVGRVGGICIVVVGGRVMVLGSGGGGSALLEGGGSI